MAKLVTDKRALKQVSRKVTAADSIELIKFELLATLQLAKGVGLAAVQIGMPVQALAYSWAGITEVLINPEIIYRSEKVKKQAEGCLSLPGVEKTVKRSYAIKIRVEGEIKEYSGMMARIIQHEVDHFNGVLISDY